MPRSIRSLHSARWATIRAIITFTIAAAVIPLSAEATQLRVIRHFQNRLFNTNAVQVLPQTSHFAKAYVVNGSKKSYFFPPDTMITQLHGTVFVRSYNSLWPFNAAKITIRQLGSSSTLNLSTLKQETNTAMAAGVTTAASYRVSISNDKCPDCITPMSRSFLKDTTYGAQPQPTEPPGIVTTPGAGDGSQSINTFLKPSGPPRPIPQSQMQYQKSAACFPSGYVVLTQFGECASTSQTGSQSQRASVLLQRARIFASLGGTAAAYLWSESEYSTYLYGSTPYLYFGTLYFEVYYFDVEAFYAYGAGQVNVFSSESCEFEIFNSYTETSETQAYFQGGQGQSLGGMQGVFADPIL